MVTELQLVKNEQWTTWKVLKTIGGVVVVVLGGMYWALHAELTAIHGKISTKASSQNITEVTKAVNDLTTEVNVGFAKIEATPHAIAVQTTPAVNGL